MSLFSFCPLYFKNDLYHVLTNKFSLTAELSLMLCALLAIAIPYVLGSLNFGIIISKLVFHDDIRNHGSGNAGSTNMLRTYGKGMAALTLAGDMLKGAFALLIGALLLNPMAGTTIDGVYVTNTPVDGIAIAALFVILGHIFPCFYRFKGGKGVATFAMVILATRPLIFLVLLVIFVIIVAGTRFVSLGSIIGALMFPILLNRLDTNYPMGWFTLSSVIIAFLIIFMHRANIKRLLAGKESKISFGKKDKASPADGDKK
jgi:glycerol-3-phosphate acyltransferase PlsY